MPDTFVHEVELDGQVYEIEGGPTPPTEAQARAAIGAYTQKPQKSIGGLVGNAVNDVTGMVSSTVGALLSPVETIKKALAAKQGWEQRGVADVEAMRSGSAPAPSLHPGVMLNRAKDLGADLLDAAYETPVTAAMLMRPSLAVDTAKGAMRGMSKVAKNPGVLVEPALEAGAGWALGGPTGAGAAVILPKLIKRILRQQQTASPSPAVSADAVAGAASTLGPQDALLLELSRRAVLTPDQLQQMNQLLQKAQGASKIVGTNYAAYGAARNQR